MKDSQWNFWEYGMSISFLILWLTCREQARIGYVEGLRKINMASEPIEFGSCFHDLLADVYACKDRPHSDYVAKCVAKYEKRRNKELGVLTGKQQETMDKIYGLNDVLMQEYLRHHKRDFGEKSTIRSTAVTPVKWLALERKFTVMHRFADGRKFPIHGIFDGVFEDKKGDLWLFETKTKAMIDADGLPLVLPWDIQVMVYLIALKRVTGRVPKGVLYNVIRRPGHRIGKKETKPEFYARMKNEVAMRPEHFFLRWEIVLPWSQVLNWKKEFLEPCLQDLRNWWEGGPHYMNPCNIIGKYGRCDVFDIIVNDCKVGYKTIERKEWHA